MPKLHSNEDRNLENLTRTQKILVFIALAFLTFLMILGYFLLSDDHTNIKYQENYVSYDEGWSVSIAGEEVPNPTLPVYVKTKKHESAIFSKTLPDNIPENYGLSLRNYHQALLVTIDNQLVFAYPPNLQNGIANLISDEWCIVPLRPEDSGKTIQISLSNSAFFPFTATIGEFYYGESNSLVQRARSQGFVKAIIGIIICIIAGLLLLVSVVFRKHTNQPPNTAMGIALMGFGIWLTNRAKMCLFPDHSIYVYFGSLIALMLVAPFVFLYSYFRNHEFKRLSLWAFRLCLLADLFLIASSFFIDYDVEIIAIFGYALTFTALILTAYSLYRGGWGKNIARKRKIDVLLDRTEFVVNLIFLILIGVESALTTDELWTDASFNATFLILLYSLLYMFFVFWRTFLVVQDRTIVTKQLHDSQLELMMSQIQPHFIFNTLSSIRTLIMIDPEASRDMLYDFSNYLRANIDNVTNLDGIPFASEVNHIKSYVNIEKVRFADRLDVVFDIQSDRFTVPPLSIQPLVENAIKHGVCKKVQGGTVVLRSYDEPDYHVVEIEDDGIGFSRQNASRVFSSYFNQDLDAELKANQFSQSVIKELMGSLKLIDKDGEVIDVTEINEPVVEQNLSGNGSEVHKSTGMMNILLRLKEMANAKVEISSTEDVGTKIRVLFPKTH